MTNYIICLSHFCELHGPSSVICTQISGDPKHTKGLLLHSNSKLQTCSSCKLELPKDRRNLLTKSSSTEYVSTQYPVYQERYKALTKLVMKTLSVETNSSSSKPLFLGDNACGYCLSRMFKIKDVNARGGERKYSLMVISDEEVKIMKNWNVITKYLSEMIASIQVKVQRVIDHKEKHNTTNSNENYLRRLMVKPKSLIELTGDSKIFVKLHLSAIQVIKDIS